VYLPELYSANGHLIVIAPDDASVLVDGARHVDPNSVVDVTPGPHEVEIRAGERSLRQTVGCAPGRVAQVDTTPRDTPAPRPVAGTSQWATAPGPRSNGGDARQWVVLTLAVTAAGATGAAVTSWLAADADAARVQNLEARIAQANVTCPNERAPVCADLVSTAAARDEGHTRSLAMFVASGALATGAVATYLLWPKAERRGGLGVRPSPGPTALGAGISGSF